MGTAKTDNSVATGIEATMMAIREYLMAYYKGSCIEQLTGDNNVRLSPVYMDLPGRRMHQRTLAKQQNHQSLHINGVHIATLQEMPSNLTLHNTALFRSPELREIRLKTIKFMGQYLRGVRIIEKGSKRMGKRDDSELVTQTKASTWLAAGTVDYGYNMPPDPDVQDIMRERLRQIVTEPAINLDDWIIDEY